MQHVLRHAALLYQWLGGGGDDETTKAIAGFLLTHPRAHVTYSDLSSKVWRCKGMDARRLQEAVSPLVVGGWLEPDGGLNPKGNRWHVNERIYRQFGERAAREKYEREQARVLIQGTASDDVEADTKLTLPEEPDGNEVVHTCEPDDQPSRARTRNLVPLEMIATTNFSPRARSGSSGNDTSLTTDEAIPLSDDSPTQQQPLTDPSLSEPLARTRARNPDCPASLLQSTDVRDAAIPLSDDSPAQRLRQRVLLEPRKPGYRRGSDNRWGGMNVAQRADVLRSKFTDRPFVERAAPVC
jgi:hypothetical protein